MRWITSSAPATACGDFVLKVILPAGAAFSPAAFVSADTEAARAAHNTAAHVFLTIFITFLLLLCASPYGPRNVNHSPGGRRRRRTTGSCIFSRGQSAPSFVKLPHWLFAM